MTLATLTTFLPRDAERSLRNPAPLVEILACEPLGVENDALMKWTFHGVTEANSDGHRLYWRYIAPEQFPGVGVVEIFQDAARSKLVARRRRDTCCH